MLKRPAQFFKEEEGASAVEYGLVAGLIAAVLVAVLLALGTGLDGLYGLIKDKVSCAIQMAC
ncbi:MAG: Flp family type IVb pilin [Nevskiaceae bacterium]|nr:MAG: Flp family type IVb pilin [Nevskiaceae bacterium]